MPVFSAELFLATVALIGAVIIVSALLSGVVERTGLPQVAVFLALGVIIGPYGTGLVDVRVTSPILRVVATLSLVLVLFTDAVSLNLKELREHKLLGFLVLGPGTLLSALLVALSAMWLLGLDAALAAMLGAALASTDPVLLRGIVRRPELSTPVRQSLRIESGLNDAVLLPIVLVAMVAAQHTGTPEAAQWAQLALKMLVLSPAAGVVVALAAIGALELVRRRIGVRRDYESLYSLGVAFAAFAAAEVVHGSGFIAAFAAGLTISALDVELCDCFLEYGETTAEMALLFTFVLFGVSIIWSGLAVITLPLLGFALLVIAARMVAFVPALVPAHITARDGALIAWFGPRGLSSLLLILLPVFAGVPGSYPLLQVCCLVVLVSVVLHGFSPSLLFRGAKPPQDRKTAAAVLPPTQPREEQAPFQAEVELSQDEYITLKEFERVKATETPVVLVDARSNRSFSDSNEVIPQAVRLDPDHSVAEATRLGLDQEAVLAIFCA